MISKKQRKSSRYWNDVVRYLNKSGYTKLDRAKGNQIAFSNNIGKQIMLGNMAALTLPQKKG